MAKKTPAKLRLNTKKKRPDTGEIGAPGNAIYGGLIGDDFNSKFHTGAQIKIYDQMRRTDPVVRATIQAIKQPIIGAGYVVNPGSEEPEHVEHAEFIRNALKKMEVPFEELLDQILNFPFMGYFYVEKVLTTDEEGMIVWKKWGPRMQSAHYKWETEEGKPGVTQILPTPIDGKGMYCSIPREKLIVFTYQQEGDNYDGFPLLRSIYRNWEMKDMLYRIQGIAAERAAGILVVTLPKGATPEDSDDADELGANFRTNEKTHIVLPSPDWKADILTAGIEGKQAAIAGEIDHHNRMITMNVLAQFMMLTNGDGGSNALSVDQGGFFTMALRGLAKQTAYVINSQAIKELIDLNFGEQEAYPSLEFGKIGQMDFTETASSLVSLAGANLLEVTPELKQWIHNAWGLPGFDIDAMREEEGEEEEMDPMDEEEPLDDDMEDDLEEEPEDGAGGDAEDPQDLLDQLDELEGLLSETVKLASRGPMPEEVKKKISEALKQGGSKQETDKEVRRSTVIIRALKNKVNGIKDQIAKLREGGKSLPKAARAKIKEQVKALREQIKAHREESKKEKSKLSLRKQVLRLESAITKGTERMAKVQEAQAKHAEKMNELRKKIAEATGEQRQKLKERLSGMEERGEMVETKRKELETRLKALTNVRKSIKASEILAKTNEFNDFMFTEHKCVHMKLAEWKPFRELTFAEQRVKFAVVNDYFDSTEERMIGLLNDYTAQQKETYRKAIEAAVQDGDIRPLKDAGSRGSDTLKKQLKREAINGLEFGKSQAAGEIGVKAPSTPSIDTQILETRIDQIVDERNLRIAKDMKEIALASISAGAGLSATQLAAEEAFTKTSDTENARIAGVLGAVAVNQGRSLVFFDNEEKIYAIQRSEILDDVTCAMCLSLDGRIFNVNDPFAWIDEVHNNCRGVNVAIVKTDADLPEIKGIPDSLRNKFDTFEGVPMSNKFKQPAKVSTPRDSRLRQRINDGRVENNPNL